MGGAIDVYMHTRHGRSSVLIVQRPQTDQGPPGRPTITPPSTPPRSSTFASKEPGGTWNPEIL